MDIQKLKTALQKATVRGCVALIGHDAPDVDSVVSCVLMAALCAPAFSPESPGCKRRASRPSFSG